jgi:hypothetical protein
VSRYNNGESKEANFQALLIPEHRVISTRGRNSKTDPKHGNSVNTDDEDIIPNIVLKMKGNPK